jgi:hypothetical protein
MAGLVLRAEQWTAAPPAVTFSLFGAGAGAGWVFDALCDRVAVGNAVSMRASIAGFGDSVDIIGRIVAVRPGSEIEMAHDQPWRGRLNARGTAAVQRGHFDHGLLVFSGTVNFGLHHVLVPGPNGFPPAAYAPGAAGDASYSPLVDVVENGHDVVLNAPQVANSTGTSGSVVSIDYGHRTVTLSLLAGWVPFNVAQEQPSDPVHYTPIWDVTPVQWTSAAIAAGKRVQLQSQDEARAEVLAGNLVSAMPGTPDAGLGGINASGAISNCPVIVVFPGGPAADSFPWL